MGVPPTNFVMSSAMRRQVLGRVFVRTLQGTEAGRKRQLSYQQVSIQQSVAGPLLPTPRRPLLAGGVAAAGAHREPALTAGTGGPAGGAGSSDSLRGARLLNKFLFGWEKLGQRTTN